jgi:hypothetical protein
MALLRKLSSTERAVAFDDGSDCHDFRRFSILMSMRVPAHLDIVTSLVQRKE